MNRVHVHLICALSLVLVPLAAAGSPVQEDAVAFPVASPESQGMSAAALAGLVEEVNGYLARDLTVGAELLVIKNRRTVLHERFGQSDRKEDEAWAEGTVCNIHSMTKTLTGAAAQLRVALTAAGRS